MITCKKCGTEFSTGREVGVHARDVHSPKSVETMPPDVLYSCISCGEYQRFEAFRSHDHTLPDQETAYDRNLEFLQGIGTLEVRHYDSFGNSDDRLACYPR